MNYLSKEELSKFKKDGYLIIHNIFSEDELLQAEKTIEGFSEKKIEDWEIGKEMAYYESNLKNTIIIYSDYIIINNVKYLCDLYSVSR